MREITSWILVLGLTAICLPAAAQPSEPMNPAAPQMVPKKPAAANPLQQDKKDQVGKPVPRSEESLRPAIGPRTTQGLAQDAITRSNGQ